MVKKVVICGKGCCCGDVRGPIAGVWAPAMDGWMDWARKKLRIGRESRGWWHDG